MNIYYNSLDKKCKNIIGAVRQDELLEFTVYGASNNCTLRYYRDDREDDTITVPMSSVEGGMRASFSIHNIGLYFYYFVIDGLKVGRGAERNAEVTDTPYQLTVYNKEFKTPLQLSGGIMYQIFPDRFAKKGDLPVPDGKILRTDWGGMPEFLPNKQGIVMNNDFFGGNLQGIISKLDYLVSLHVTTIYLNPIFKAFSNHRYDTGNYMEIDPLLGSKNDFQELVNQAKERGISIILDGVFNHTGDDSLYFNKYGHYSSVGAYQDKNSPYHDWYNFQRFPDKYDSWWGITTLPAVNERSEGYRNYIFGENGVIKTWLRCGIAGYRLDVADELPDFFLKELRKAVKDENPDAVVLGEVWEDASNKVSYGVRREYFQGDELDSVMNYPLKNAIIDYVLYGNCNGLVETIKMLVDHYPAEVLHCLMNNLSTHDTARILTVMGGIPAYSKEEMAVSKLDEKEAKSAMEKVKMCSVLQYTMPGIPCVYYGDENGMQGYGDPFCRRCFDWENLNGDTISFFRKLGEIRSQLQDVLSTGEYVDVFHDDSLMIYARTTATDHCFVYTNNSETLRIVRLNGTFKELLSEQTFTNEMLLQPHSYGILVKNK